MRKLYVVKHQHDFDRIITKNNFIKSNYFVIYQENNDLKYDCFGISVGKKLGNAVVRNKNKRQIKDIIDKSNLSFKRENDYVIILRKEISKYSFDEKKKYLLDILCKLEGEQDE